MKNPINTIFLLISFLILSTNALLRAEEPQRIPVDVVGSVGGAYAIDKQIAESPVGSPIVAEHYRTMDKILTALEERHRREDRQNALIVILGVPVFVSAFVTLAYILATRVFIRRISAWVLCALLAAVLTGCAGDPGTGQRVAFDSLATGAGGYAAYEASGHDPALTTAGAVGGFVVSEMAQAIAKSGRHKAFNSGVEEGRALEQQEVLQDFWEKSNGLPKVGSHTYQNLSPALVVPARVQNGVIYDAHVAPPVTNEPEKVLIRGTKNSPFQDHYETFQTTK